MIAVNRTTYLFDFGEERVEILALGAVVFSQSRLHQTPKAKSIVVHTHHAGTMRALVVLVRGR
jgi:hypothetical protein